MGAEELSKCTFMPSMNQMRIRFAYHCSFFNLRSNVIQLPHKDVHFSAKQCGEFTAICCCSKLVLVEEREFNKTGFGNIAWPLV